MALPHNQSSEQSSEDTVAPSLDPFDDRYGAGSFATLLTMLGQPCVSFARIGHRFGVSRECVRRWQLKFQPDAPGGHSRRRLCAKERRRRSVLADPLFRTFYRHARAHHFAPRDVGLIEAHDGFRKRLARLDGRVIAIKNARPLPASRHRMTASYMLTGSVQSVDFIYYRLTDSEYLVVPQDTIPRGGTTFLDTPVSRCLPYRNSFVALRAEFPDDTRYLPHRRS